MSQVIAGLYEIEKQIGAGGGGIVYLGRHIRLEKPVVLKADKRTLSVGTDALRREVDLLKDLTQTYIPKVYDFVQENGSVYTVMDYIEGESLDKLLGRGQKITQPEVIKWAVQLLEALCYLHSRPPHGILHGDIKPANIMLRPSGDICLIDFNIALALGEDGAVKVGFSRGYASPEHYGADYISANRAASVGESTRGQSKLFSKKQKSQPNATDGDVTQTDGDVTLADADVTLADGDVTIADGDVTQADGDVASADARISGAGSGQRSGGSAGSTGGTGSTASGSKSILLDVRSDIYSLGATLYHLLSGMRPPQSALEVQPLGPEVCSPAVSAILQKAMAPSPAMRYQTTEEMLTAFLQIHKQDERVLRHKRRIVRTTAALTGLFLLGGASTFVGLKQMEQRQSALTLSEYSANALIKGDVSGAVRTALEAIPMKKSLLEAPVTAQAQKDALGVYDLADGFKALDSLELPGAPFRIKASPKGSYFVAVYGYELAVYDGETQQKLCSLPIQNSALSDVVFIDEEHLVYAGEQGVTGYEITARTNLWTGDIATTLALSGDGKVVAAVDRASDKAILYEALTGTKLGECSFDGKHLSVAVNDIFADPEDNIFALNEDGSKLAVSFDNGGLYVYDLKQPEETLIVYEESAGYHFEGGFCGQYFAFNSTQSNGSSFGLIDTQQAAYVGGFDAQTAMLLDVSDRGIYLANGSVLVSLNPETLEETELAYTENANIIAFSVGENYVLTATDNNHFAFYDSGAHLSSTEECAENMDFVSLTENYAVLGNRNEPTLRLMKLEKHEDADLMAYDARKVHEEARISQNGERVMLFDYQSFSIYDMSGNLLLEQEIPNADQIYDQQFVKSQEGSWLEVIWYDGMRRTYSAQDGSILSEEQGAPPAKDLYEEFLVDGYRIASSLHTAPEVYEQKSGKLVTTLEKDSYLTYVTQAGDYYITEYISSAGVRYGLLLNQNFETLAYLPGLCDVWGDMLVFDYESGNLRQCRLYSLQELVALGESYTQK